jgi:ADP-heptose:LPS heptosyltransferase
MEDALRILVRRTGALGDVVLATPVVRWLHEFHGAEVFVETAYPDVFRNNPHVSEDDARGIAFDRVVDLDGAYETRLGMHVVDAYFAAVMAQDAGPVPADQRAWRQELFFQRKPLFPSRKRMVAVHAAVPGWRNRTLPRATWRAVVEGLRSSGLTPVLVGTERDALDGVDCPQCLTGDVLFQANVIASCACFVGVDTSLMHVAGATDTPIVAAFTCTRPDDYLPFRENCVAVTPLGLDCLGCAARRESGSTTETCERGDLACVSAVRAEDILTATFAMLDRTRL